MLLISLLAVTGDLPMTIGVLGCNTTCGNVSVLYPFGVGPDMCYFPGFKLTCDHGSNPARLLLGDGGANASEVVDISLEDVMVRVVSHMNGGQWSLGGGGLPYILKPDSNEFILAGCDVQATLLGNGSIVSGCVSFCATIMEVGGGYTQYDRPDGADPNPRTCSNLGCCQSPVVIGSTSYSMDLKRLNNSVRNDSRVTMLIAEVGWFDPVVFFDLGHDNFTELALRAPVVLQWVVTPHSDTDNDNTDSDNETRECPSDAALSVCKSANSSCRVESYWTLTGYSCQCNGGYLGNPYLTGGCQDIKECDRKEIYGCFGDCEELPGSFQCRCPEGTHGNYTLPGGCVKSADTIAGNLGLIIGLLVASGPCILLLVLGALQIIHDLKQRKGRKLRRKFFSQNRGQLLKQLVSHRADIAERMLISLEELEKATNNFDRTRRLGGGGHGTVYKGILSDLHVVAIKKSNINVKREIDEFINEVAILSQINHRNIVKLRGCCLETEVPLLAYEFISNGTLSDHLHTEEPRSLPWKDRLRIMTEISKALAYLHSAVSVPVIHRDIKPSNILLDDALTAKVSDFGASRYVSVDQAGPTTAVQGTIGYLDPMYYYNGRLTENSDVYSFGVLLVELLTRRQPSLYRSSEGDGIVTRFLTLLAEDNLSEILDPQVVKEGCNVAEEVASVAASCIKLRAEERPTMRQVEMALEALQVSKEHVAE
uniref:Uncharacterized protein n=1 Tax=Avena sativa TaxID=4498 RepID=A0ACD5Y2U8_AVESA